jgi:hypothetical protein
MVGGYALDGVRRQAELLSNPRAVQDVVYDPVRHHLRHFTDARSRFVGRQQRQRSEDQALVAAHEATEASAGGNRARVVEESGVTAGQTLLSVKAGCLGDGHSNVGDALGVSGRPAFGEVKGGAYRDKNVAKSVSGKPGCGPSPLALKLQSILTANFAHSTRLELTRPFERRIVSS